MAEQAGTRESRLGFSLGPDHISFEVEESLYPLEAVYGACYLFLEKCFVYLSRPRSEVVGVRLTAREPSTPAQLDTLAYDEYLSRNDAHGKPVA